MNAYITPIIINPIKGSLISLSIHIDISILIINIAGEVAVKIIRPDVREDTTSDNLSTIFSLTNSMYVLP